MVQLNFPCNKLFELRRIPERSSVSDGLKLELLQVLSQCTTLCTNCCVNKTGCDNLRSIESTIQTVAILLYTESMKFLFWYHNSL